jgi:hypothetical protein
MFDAIDNRDYTIFIYGLVSAIITTAVFVALGCLLGGVCYLTRGKPNLQGCAIPLTIFLFFFIPFLLMLPAIQDSREAARRRLCESNMTQIGVALRNYHDHHGSFPPAYTVDEEGNPLHSWRTLILPYFTPDFLDSKWKDFYDQIRFDEPWDSEYHKNLLEEMPDMTEGDHLKYPPDNEGPHHFFFY